MARDGLPGPGLGPTRFPVTFEGPRIWIGCTMLGRTPGRVQKEEAGTGCWAVGPVTGSGCG